MPSEFQDRTVFLLGATSDIGRDLARRFTSDGARVIGTYRNEAAAEPLRHCPGLDLVRCDLSNPDEFPEVRSAFQRFSRPWDVWISAVGTMEPIGPFFDVGFQEWASSVGINALAPLRLLHGMHPFRRRDRTCHVGFFAGGGTNGPMPRYSAYCASKIFLIKMCELIDNENDDLNCFIVGPGWVRTKIHQQTLSSAARAGDNYDRTARFLQTDSPGTPLSDIYGCITWCIEQGKPVIGGRNVSVVHDPWRSSEGLAGRLRDDPDMFKLRRHRNGE